MPVLLPVSGEIRESCLISPDSGPAGLQPGYAGCWCLDSQMKLAAYMNSRSGHIFNVHECRVLRAWFCPGFVDTLELA